MAPLIRYLLFNRGLTPIYSRWISISSMDEVAHAAMESGTRTANSMICFFANAFIVFLLEQLVEQLGSDHGFSALVEQSRQRRLSTAMQNQFEPDPFD
ncbi:MAG: hypothetical protein Q8J96_06770 [Rhodocyclaceae bacterium]|nr:hypothetical protein [Rhodocyclaceae bacterium]